jgi:hypothetical protein
LGVWRLEGDLARINAQRKTRIRGMIAIQHTFVKYVWLI